MIDKIPDLHLVATDICHKSAPYVLHDLQITQPWFDPLLSSSLTTETKWKQVVNVEKVRKQYDILVIPVTST